MTKAQQKIPASNPDNRSFQGCLDRIAEQDTEIKRLEIAILDKDGEIARLKHESDQWELEAGKAWEDLKRVTYDKGMLGDLLYKMEAKANTRGLLITELTDALKQSHLDLIQRARQEVQNG